VPFVAAAQEGEGEPPAGASGPLEEVVVTATFRATNVQDTPLAITAVNSEMLEARSQTNIVDVAAQAPNVTLKPAGQESGHAMIAFIRGIGQTDFNYAVEPGVGVYVDDVYYPTLTGSMIDLLDVDRVEVLRGPQGTLAGLNSIGGAIKLFSRAPDRDGGGNLAVTYGDYNRVDVRGNVSVDLVDNKLYARLAGASRQRDGYVKRLDYRCVHPTSGLPTYIAGGDLSGCQVGTEGGQSYTGGRVYLEWLPTDRLTFDIIADAVEDNSEAGANVLLRVNEGRNNPNLPALGIAGNPIGVNGGDFNGDGVPDGTFYDQDGNYATASDRIYYSNAFVTQGPYAADPVLRDPYATYSTYLDPNPPLPNRPYSPAAVPAISTLHQDGLSISADWNINDKLNFRSITAYREYTSDWGNDVDASPFASQQLLQRLEHHHFTQEFRLNGQAFDDKLDYTVGTFYVDQDGTLEANVDLYYAQLDFVHGPDPTPSTSKAIFGNTVWHMNDRMDLSLGVRATDESKTYVYHRRNPDGTLPSACTGDPNAVTTPPNCVLQGLFGVSGHFSDSRFDWRATFDWHLTDNIMWYTQAATGYKGGGINPRPFFLVQIESFQPEQLTSYEMGVKTVLANGRLRLNSALFYNDYTDIQINQTQCEVPFPPFFGAPCLQPGNAGDADVKGAEVEAEANLGDKWLIDFSYSALDFEYTRLQPNVAVTLDMITPFTPEAEWSAGVQYEVPLPGGGSLTPRIDASYQDTIYSAPTNNAANRIPSYTLANFRLTWRSPNDDWQAALEGTNLGDKLYYNTIFEQYDSSGTVAASPGAPRMWALTLKRSF
jgi:iron complex outermembrane receptor protein